MSGTVPGFDVSTDDGIPVRLPSGTTYYVITEREAHELGESIRRYLADNHFINISDIKDIDQMVVMEQLIRRWTLWISRGKDYWDRDINTKTFSDMVQDASREVRQLKKSLGVDKATRDRTRGDDSIPALWADVLRRGKEFGYMRNEQLYAVITAFQRIKAVMSFHDACDELERKENACETSDIIEVLREEIAKFDQVDEKFKREKQSIWIRSQ